jgi:hypothetical protein
MARQRRQMIRERQDESERASGGTAQICQYADANNSTKNKLLTIARQRGLRVGRRSPRRSDGEGEALSGERQSVNVLGMSATRGKAMMVRGRARVKRRATTTMTQVRDGGEENNHVR